MGKASIIVITTPGSSKRELVDLIQEQTKGAVSLVVVQVERKRSLLERFTRAVKKVRILELPSEAWNFVIMNLSTRKKRALGLVKLRTPLSFSSVYPFPRVLETYDVNDASVVEAIRAENPSVIAIWGGLIVRDETLAIPKYTLNMHHGYCPYYRGTNCNFHALLAGDHEHVGMTIHEATSVLDGGCIYRTIAAKWTHPSIGEVFRDLNDRALEAYAAVVAQLYRGETLSCEKQNISLGRNYRLSEWTYTKRKQVADLLLSWRNEGKTHG